MEDDEDIAELIRFHLQKQGYATGIAMDGKTALEQFDAARPALILLDVMLPVIDGLEVLKAIRYDRHSTVPIIIESARGEETDIVTGLELGADDYIAKPFGMMELMARIRTALRHAGGREEPENVYRLGQLYADPGRHIVRDGERDVALTLKEFQLLCLLLEHRGTVFTRDQLLNTIWGYEFDGASRTVDVHIRTLRQKLGESGGCIETVRGVGYKIAEG